MHGRITLLCLLIACLAFTQTKHLPAQSSTPWDLTPVPPETIGMLSTQLKYIDDAVTAAIQAREIPGAVILVARRGWIGYFKAFGQRAIKPQAELMTKETIFDVASLTKVMATTPAIMLLVEKGIIRLGERVKRYLPEFTGGGKDAITVRHLLTHYSGLRPDFDLSVAWEGYPAALQELWKESTRGEPNKDFAYSDLNFIALGEIVQRMSGKSLDTFVRENLYRTLGMLDTGFNPSVDSYGRIAPTESRARTLAYLKGDTALPASQEILRGVVHDPTAWRMGGIAGHAGLFSSARDIAIYAQMLLNRGTFRSTRIFSPITVKAMTSRQSPQSGPVRGFGWDIESSLSAPRGDLFDGGFGHTGFTGTSLWIHPASELFVIILSNRVHPEGKGDVTHLRAIIANIVAASLID